ncbi:MAG: PP2C family protein-serine/threonine phosphatase [Acutalibacteraceae bacterium]
MRFSAIADTDVGISKDINQDSIVVKHALYGDTEVLMAIICDGMGGLSNGELASATVIRMFSKWFDKSISQELKSVDMEVICGKWLHMIRTVNLKILEYGKKIKSSLGTTFSGILIVNDQYLIEHVGDSRIYHIDKKVKQLTTDQTYVAREVRRGNMTPEQAKTDKRRNLLLQCIGAVDNVEPEIAIGKIKNGIYMLCSDGLRHEISEDEMYKALMPDNLKDKNVMRKSARSLIDLVKSRQEKDNISIVLIKVNKEESK